MTAVPAAPALTTAATPILEARGLVKHYGHIIAMDGADFDLYPGEIVGVVGDNGAGKSTMIKVLSGAVIPDAGTILIDGESVKLNSPLAARRYGIETLYQDLALAPALDVATNLFLGRELRHPGLRGRVFRSIDSRTMIREARLHLDALGVRIPEVRQAVENLSGGQRQCLSVARCAAFGTRVVIMDEPTAALGVRESAMVVDLILRIRDGGIPIILISHNMPHVVELADRIHIHRLGRRAALLQRGECTMAEIVAIMTGAIPAPGAATDGTAEENGVAAPPAWTSGGA